jgi:hypothetical protein
MPMQKKKKNFEIVFNKRKMGGPFILIFVYEDKNQVIA